MNQQTPCICAASCTTLQTRPCEDAGDFTGHSRPPEKRRRRAPGEGPTGHHRVSRKRSRPGAGHAAVPADRAARRPRSAQQPGGWGLPRLGDREDMCMGATEGAFDRPAARSGAGGSGPRATRQRGPRERPEQHRDAAEQFGHVIELDGASEPERGTPVST